jgi:hypothetical protein
MTEQQLATEQQLVNRDIFVFVAPVSIDLAAPGAEEDYGKIKDFFTRSKAEVAAEWDAMVDRLRAMLTEIDVQVGRFRLDSVEFELGFSAEGHIGFIAKAGATASVKVTFARAPG